MQGNCNDVFDHQENSKIDWRYYKIIASTLQIIQLCKIHHSTIPHQFEPLFETKNHFKLSSNYQATHIYRLRTILNIQAHTLKDS